MRDLIEAYRTHLADKSSGAQRAFASIAAKLAPLADRGVLTITPSMWESWLEEATASFSPSYCLQVRAYLKAMLQLQGTAHWLPRGPSRPRAGSRPALTDHEQQALKRGPQPGRRFRDRYRTERDQLLGSLVCAGFYVGEIQAISVAGDGRVELGRPNWGRHRGPASLPSDLERRLHAYAVANGIPPGERVFPLSDQGIRDIVARARRRTGSLPQRLRECLRGAGSLPIGAMAQALDAKPGSVYAALRTMKDVIQLSDRRGRGHHSMWALVPPPPGRG